MLSCLHRKDQQRCCGRSWIQILLAILLLLTQIVPSTLAFLTVPPLTSIIPSKPIRPTNLVVPPITITTATTSHKYYGSPSTTTSQLRAVTEEQVIAVVEEAEALWAEALEARKKADEAAGKAEAVQAAAAAEAAAAAASSESDKYDSDVAAVVTADTSHLDAKIISMAEMADDIEVDVYVKEAEQYSEKADEIELRAEAKLAESERLLDQHLLDFPDSTLQN